METNTCLGDYNFKFNGIYDQGNLFFIKITIIMTQISIKNSGKIVFRKS